VLFFDRGVGAGVVGVVLFCVSGQWDWGERCFGGSVGVGGFGWVGGFVCSVGGFWGGRFGVGVWC